MLVSRGIFDDEDLFRLVRASPRKLTSLLNLEVFLMEGFDRAESIEEFKNRVNSLTEKLNKTDKNRTQASSESVRVA
jgi:hypothetical protein